MSLPSSLALNSLLERQTKTGSFVYSEQINNTLWSDNLIVLLGLHAITNVPCPEWELPCFSEHTKQLIKNRINVSQKSRGQVDINVPCDFSDKAASSDNNDISKRWFRYYCEFVDTEFGVSRIGFFQDITASIELSRPDSHDHERIQMSLLSVNTATWDYQVVSNELVWDDAMHRLFGTQKSSQVLRFSDWLRLIHPESQESFLRSFNVTHRLPHDDEFVDTVFQFINPVGNTIYIEVSARFFRNQLDKIVRVTGTCHDVSEREMQTHALLEQATIAQKNELIAHDAIAARARFIANVSHELRTPMNTIMGALQILQSYDFNDDIQAILDMATTSSNDLLHTINEVLDLSKVDAQTLDIEQIDLNILKLIENVVEKYRDQAKPGITLTTNIALKFENNRLGDPIRFNQVMSNLLSNAVKFTESGTIELSVTGDEKQIEVSVKDTGIGIAAEHIELIFEPFRQSDESTIRQFGGSGLGLAISRKLAKLMGGTVDVISELGKGAEFRLHLPMPVISDNIMNLGSNKLSDTVPDLSEHHILYAEDDSVNVEIVKQLLRPTKASVEVAIDGKQAISLYRVEKSISMIILDVDIPLIDGVEVCERIRRENRSIPIIALATAVGLQDQKHFYNAGFTHIIQKPIKFDNFYDVLASI